MDPITAALESLHRSTPAKPKRLVVSADDPHAGLFVSARERGAGAATIMVQNQRRDQDREQRLADSRPTHNESYRALQLPYVEPLEIDMAPWRKDGCRVDLWPKQLEALWQIRYGQGGLICLPVGAGKGFVGLLAGAVLDVDLVLYLCPPVTLSQMNQYLAIIDNSYRIPRTQLLSYGRLSGAKGEKELRGLIGDVPDDRLLIVADEAHCLKNRTAARTKRFIRWFREFPQTRLVAMSGTMTTRSLEDFAHLSELALRGKSPLPRVRRQLRTWCRLIDVQTGNPAQGAPRPPGDGTWLSMMPMWSKVHPGTPIDAHDMDERRTMLRQAFAHRMSHTGGVAIQHEASVGASLLFDSLDGVAMPLVVTQALAALEPRRSDGSKIEVTDWSGEAVDGERAKRARLAQAMESPRSVNYTVGTADVHTARLLPGCAVPLERWRLQQQLSKGFYLRWVWPHNRPDEEWLQARRDWGRVVSNELRDNATRGYDSPMLVASRISREALTGKADEQHVVWNAWAKVKDREKPPTEVVWLSEALFDRVDAWVADNSQHGKLIIWYSDIPVADKLAERGYRVVRGGDNVGALLHGGVQVLCLSAHAHAVGLNLQAVGRQLLLGWAGGARGIEQLLGRTHRAGQLRDEVWATLPLWSEPLRDAWATVLRDARYIQQTTGGQQKVLFAVYTGGAAVSRPDIDNREGQHHEHF